MKLCSQIVSCTALFLTASFIGRARADREKFMSASDFEVLRACYVSQLNFTGMSFDRALRYFLCDANFLLPGEGQKVDRLMMAFRYARGRIESINSADDARIFSIAIFTQ